MLRVSWAGASDHPNTVHRPMGDSIEDTSFTRLLLETLPSSCVRGSLYVCQKGFKARYKRT